MARNASAEAQTSAEELERPEPASGHREGCSVNQSGSLDRAAHRLEHGLAKQAKYGQRRSAHKGSRAGQPGAYIAGRLALGSVIM